MRFFYAFPLIPFSKRPHNTIRNAHRQHMPIRFNDTFLNWISMKMFAFLFTFTASVCCADNTASHTFKRLLNRHFNLYQVPRRYKRNWIYNESSSTCKWNSTQGVKITILYHPPFFREIRKQLNRKKTTNHILMKFSSLERVLRLK